MKYEFKDPRLDGQVARALGGIVMMSKEQQNQFADKTGIRVEQIAHGYEVYIENTQSDAEALDKLARALRVNENKIRSSLNVNFNEHVNRLKQLAGITEGQSINYYDQAANKANNPKHIDQLIDRAVEALMNKDQDIDEENIISWLRSHYRDLSTAELNAVRSTLADQADTSPVEQQERATSKTQAWDTVSQMVLQAEQKGLVENLGTKRYGGQTYGAQYHEFAIDGQRFKIVPNEK